MQIRKIIYGLALSLCLAGTSSYAQSYTPTPVTVSREKVKVNGKIYYSHVVLEKQTLYSISKVYGVSIADIQASNPGLTESGLRKNAIILIPVPDNKGNAERKSQESETYVVRWFDTLESIAEKFKVSVEDLVQANGIKDGKIKSRDVLIIPARTSSVPKHHAQVSVPQQLQDTVSTESGQRPELTPDENDRIPEEDSHLTFKKKQLNLALVLPFKARSANPSISSFDFYSGVLMAVKKISSEGMDVQLKVFDSSDQLKATELRNFDYIIGPVSPDDIARTCEIAGTTPVISPLDPRAAQLTSRYGNLIQAPTPHAVQYADLIQWLIQETAEGDRIVLVKEKSARKESGMEELVNILNLTETKYGTISYNILEGRDIIEKFRKEVCPEGKITRFLIASENEAFVNDVIRNVNLLSHENNKVEIYCTSKVRSFDLEVANLHDNNLHVSLAYWIDYDNPNTIEFVKAYRALMGTEPTQFSFQGYDITCWCAGLKPEELLQMSFDFKEGEHSNSAVKRIVYRPHFKIERVK